MADFDHSTLKCITTEFVHRAQIVENYSLKTERFLVMRDRNAIGFDIVGAWQDQKVLKDLFESTPMYMRDYHEDEELDISRDKEDC